VTISVPEEHDTGADSSWRPEEEERLSPPPGIADTEMESSHTVRDTRRDRSISEPKHHMLVECNSVGHIHMTAM